MQKLKVEYVDVGTLKPYERNAKIHTDEQVDQIARSIEEFGMNDPIAVWKDGEIIEGHGRLMACQKLGITEVPIIRLDGLTDEQRRAYMNVHNQLTMNTGFDIDLLAEELGKIENIDMSMFGFNIDDFINKEEQESVEDEYTEPEDLEPIVQRGQRYRLGEHVLMCGDSTDVNDVEKLLDGNFMRMTVTSPPYGVGKDYEETGVEPWRKTISGVINAIKGKTLIICWNIGDLFSTGTQFTEPTGAYSIQMMSDAGYGMLYNRIWKKPGGNFAGNNPYYTVTTKPVQDYEYLYAFAEKDADRHLKPIKDYLFSQAKKANISNSIVKSIGGPGFMCGHWFTNHQWTFIDKKNYKIIQKYCAENGISAFERDYDELNDEYLRNTIFSHNLPDSEFSEWGLYGVWEFSTVHERLGGHAAAFPVELPTRYIKIHSYENDSVFDPFGGTGTTLIACEQLNRKCYMMEYDPHYCDVIIDRWEKFTGRKAELIDD